MVYDTGTVGCPNLAFTCWQMGHCTNSLAAAWYSPVSVTSPATHKINLSISKEVYIDLTRVSTVLTFVSSNITSCCSDIYALPFMPVYPQYYIIITMFPRGGRGWKVLDEQLRGEEKKGGGYWSGSQVHMDSHKSVTLAPRLFAAHHITPAGPCNFLQ